MDSSSSPTPNAKQPLDDSKVNPSSPEEAVAPANANANGDALAAPTAPAPAAAAANANPPEAPVQIPQPQDDREYGCKYCNKKFSNKQALGGHQNAHKMERAMEKNPIVRPENPFAYTVGGGAASGPGEPSTFTGLMMMMSNPSGSTNPNFLGSSFNRSHDFVNRSIVNWPYTSPHQQQRQQQQQEQQQQLQNAFQQQNAFQMRYNNPPGFVPARPLPGYNNVYNPGWTAAPAAPLQARPGPPPPRVNNPYNYYQGQPSSYMQQQQNHHQAQVMNNNHLRLPPATGGGGGGGGAMMRPVFNPGLSLGIGGGPRIRPGNMNPGGGNRNLQLVVVNERADEQVEDSEMDLSLRL